MMIYFKDPNGKVFAYQNQAEFENYAAIDLVPMTETEVDAHLNPLPVPPTPEQIQEFRRRAYSAESDPLKNEAEYDALVNGTEPDYTAWMAAVEAIKARYPLPEL